MARNTILKYLNLNDAASLYIENAFIEIDLALENEYVKNTIGRVEFNYSHEDLQLSKNIEQEGLGLIQFLRSSKHPLQDEIYLNFITRRAIAIDFIKKNRHKFDKKQEITDVKILAHVTSLALFLETIVNRHFHYLLETEMITQEEYYQLERPSVLVKLLYIAKGETLKFDSIKKLFALRNKAVHYTATNALAKSVTIEILTGIWKQLLSILEYLNENEEFGIYSFAPDLKCYIEEFEERWT